MMKQHECIVSDMDQVVCYSQSIHGRIESEIIGSFGITITPNEIATKFTGIGTEYVFEHYLGIENAKVALAKKEDMLHSLTENDILEVPGAVSFFRKTRECYRLGLGSGSSLRFIDLVLRSLKLSETFEVIASGEEVRRGKPEPDIFVLALDRLGCDPTKTIIIEDGTSGIIAAKRIGATAVGITTSYGSGKLKEAGADYVVESFEELGQLLKL